MIEKGVNEYIEWERMAPLPLGHLSQCRKSQKLPVSLGTGTESANSIA